jgi:hypothetical protein
VLLKAFHSLQNLESNSHAALTSRVLVTSKRGLQMISDSHLFAFSLDGGGREFNDATNKKREEFVALVVAASEATRAQYRGLVSETRTFDSVVRSLDGAIAQMGQIDPDLKGFGPTHVDSKGGMGNNYDFLLRLSDGSQVRHVKIELKKGQSIFKQPQFLSLYVKAPGVVRATEQIYSEYFYDNYFKQLQKITRCPAIGRHDYLRAVYGTTYLEPTFQHLYRFVKSSKANRSTLSQLQHESIDAYLRRLLAGPSAVDFEGLQRRLFEQVEKWFLSWDPTVETFKWERFEVSQLTLSGKVQKKTRTNGQISSLCMPTLTGQEVQMLLRWKNNPCVKGPAWQVRLTEG